MKVIRPTTISDTGAFSRASIGTYFGRDGLMKTAGVNDPRYEYDPVSLAFRGLLIEESRTNLLTNSISVDTNDGWSNGTNITRVGSATAPDGTNTATTYTTTSGSRAYVAKSVSLSANTTYTLSVYARLRSGSVPSNGALLVVDYDSNNNAGTLERETRGWSGLSSSWSRFSLTFTNVAAVVSASVYICTDFANGAQIDVWGAQLEVGSFQTSYIPTTTTAVTRAADVISGSGLIYSTVPETDAAAWESGTTYALDALVIKSHRIWKSIQASNTNHDPDTSPTWWLDTGPTNRWAMFDGVVGTSTSASTSLSVTLKPGLIDSIALLAVDAQTVDVALVAGVETVYSKTITLIDDSSVSDWYGYFFEPVAASDYVAFTDIPPYGEAEVTITISKTSGTVSCGVCVVGLKSELGTTLRNPTLGIADYSKKSTDDFGRTYLVQRGFAKTMSTKLALNSAEVDRVTAVLAGIRATPAVWVGSDSYSSMLIYGFFRDFSIDIAYPNVSYCSLQVEGMI